MYLESGSPKDARQIAAVYRDAFPDSIRLFFGKKQSAKLLDLLEHSFKIVFYWGGQAVLAKDEEGQISGYCFYDSSLDRVAKRNYAGAASSVFKMGTKIGFFELAKLMQNSLTMALSTRHNKKVPKPEARILSIAVDPAYQGQGVGTLLLTHVLGLLQNQSVGLNVRTDNPAGRRLYEQAGFLERGTTHDLQGQWIALARPRA